MAEYPPTPPGTPTAGAGQSNGLAIAGMVCGIASCVLVWIISLFVLPIAIVGLILSIMGNKRSNEMGGVGKGMAIAGIITNIIALVLVVIFGVIIGIFLSQADDVGNLLEQIEQQQGMAAAVRG